MKDDRAIWEWVQSGGRWRLLRWTHIDMGAGRDTAYYKDSFSVDAERFDDDGEELRERIARLLNEDEAKPRLDLPHSEMARGTTEAVSALEEA